jgi:hypothetical protein
MRIGDAVAVVTKKLGIEPCDECEKRRQWLNDLGKMFGGEDENSKPDDVYGVTPTSKPTGR